MDGISRSRGWDKEIPHGISPMEQLVLSDKWARIPCPTTIHMLDTLNLTWAHMGKDNINSYLVCENMFLIASTTVNYHQRM